MTRRIGVIGLMSALTLLACEGQVGDVGALEETATSTRALAVSATLDTVLGAPRCAGPASSCTSGTLLTGRAGLGPELNTPNTLGRLCRDGSSGSFHRDESLDALRVSTVDGSNFAAGKLVVVEATVWAYASYSSDKLDVYAAPNAAAPVWTLVGTATPSRAGAQTITLSFTLPAGAADQVVRGQFRYGGTASPCTAGSYNEADDLVFAVSSNGVDAGQVDAGQVDAGQVDAGQVDAGQVDAGQVDAGQVDAGQVDAGQVDAGQADAGQADAGSAVDAGAVDAGAAPGSDGGTVRVDLDSAGGQVTGSVDPSFGISDDGKIVAFASYATALVPNDTNNAQDIFVRDLTAGTTTRVNLRPGGVQGIYGAYTPRLSADGRFIVFWTGDQLLPSDTFNAADVYLFDRQTQATQLISAPMPGATHLVYGNSVSPWISPDGRYVAFVSTASDLVLGDPNTLADVFVFDRQLGTMKRLLGLSGAQPNGAASLASVTSSGNVVFTSSASNLVSGDTNAREDVFFFDGATSVTSRVSLNSSGGQTLPSTSLSQTIPSASDDGRYVVFISSAADLVSSDTNDWDDVFLRDRQTGVTSRVNVDAFGTQGLTGTSRTPRVSPDGRYVSFHTYANNLGNGRGIFVKDRQTGALTRQDVGLGGALPSVGGDYGGASANGLFVGFISPANNLVLGDTNATYDLFLTPRR